MNQVKWAVQFHFINQDIRSIMFVVDDFNSALNVIRVIKFEDEVFRIEIKADRDWETL